MMKCTPLAAARPLPTALSGNTTQGLDPTSRLTIVRNNLLQLLDDYLGSFVGESHHPFDSGQNGSWIVAGAVGNGNFRVGCREMPFTCHVQLLKQLLAGPQTYKLDLDVLARFQPGKTNHVGSQIEDADRVTHVEHEDLSSITHGSRLDNESGGFGNGHEVSLD